MKNLLNKNVKFYNGGDDDDDIFSIEEDTSLMID